MTTSTKSFRNIIGDLSNPSAALTLLNAVEHVYEKLAETPNMYALCQKPPLSRRGYRKVPIGGYLMIYKIDEMQNSYTLSGSLAIWRTTKIFCKPEKRQTRRLSNEAEAAQVAASSIIFRRHRR